MTYDLGLGLAGRFPAFPWDTLAASKRKASEHSRGVVDLSVGTPIDPVPELIQRALTRAADAPGYPTAAGTPEVRQAAAQWMERRLNVIVDEADIMPVIGSKELVAWLPTLLGLGSGATVVVPELAYPTYDIGARVVGAQVVATDSTVSVGPAQAQLLWLNSPSNPTGAVLPVEHMRKVVNWARERRCLVVSDECYIELGWDEQPVSVLHPDVCGANSDGLLALHSLSKRSNLAGYRAGFVAGDATVVRQLLAARRHLGMLMPAPVQAAMVAALGDDEHVVQQRARYHRRREWLRQALVGAGFRIDSSQGGLYLWVSRDEPCWDSVDWFASLGVLVAPGEFYGARGKEHVRLALTATDEQIEEVVRRLAAH